MEKRKGGIFMIKYYPVEMCVPAMIHIKKGLFIPQNIPLKEITCCDKLYNQNGDLVSIQGGRIIENNMDLDEYKITFRNGTVLHAISKNTVVVDTEINGIKALKNKETVQQLYNDMTYCEGISITIDPIPTLNKLPWKDFPTGPKPYTMGVLLMTCNPEEHKLLTINMDTEKYPNMKSQFIVIKMAHLEELHAILHNNYWNFTLRDDATEHIQTEDFFQYFPKDENGKYYRGIPGNYLYATYENRLELIKGIFDVAGSIVWTNNCYIKSYAIKIQCAGMHPDLKYDLIELLTSMGFILFYDDRYNIIADIHNHKLMQYFSIPSLYYKAVDMALHDVNQKISYKIKSIEKVSKPNEVIELDVNSSSVLVGNYIPF